MLARFLVHRYSVLQQHAEANGLEGVDTLDAGTHASKTGYHDDSDEASDGGVCVCESHSFEHYLAIYISSL